MDRELISKRELKEILQKLVDERTERDNDHVIMSITWHEPDENGCNWSQRFHGDHSWTDAVLAIEAELQSKYNLVNGGNS